MSTLEHALAFAAHAHAGQIDKAGEVYILHPIRVMQRVRGSDERIAAILHDVVEDTSVTLDDLRREGFNEDVVRAVEHLTERDGLPLDDDGTAVRTMPLADREWAIRHVLQYGPEAEIVEPVDLRAEVVERLQGILHRQ